MIHLLAQIDERQLSGETLRSCCRHFDLQPSQARRWRKLKEDLSNPAAANKALLCAGRASNPSGLKDRLLRWFFELREQGIMVSVRLITLRALRTVCCVQKEVHQGKRSFNPSILGSKQDSPLCSDAWVSASSRAGEKGGTWFHWVCKAKAGWSKPRPLFHSQDGPDSNLCWHVLWANPQCFRWENCHWAYLVFVYDPSHGVWNCDCFRYAFEAIDCIQRQTRHKDRDTRISHLPSRQLLRMPRSCLNGWTSPATVRSFGSQTIRGRGASRCAAIDFAWFILLPHDGQCSQCHQRPRCANWNHTWWLHRTLQTKWFWNRYASQKPSSTFMGRKDDQWRSWQCCIVPPFFLTFDPVEN